MCKCRRCDTIRFLYREAATAGITSLPQANASRAIIHIAITITKNTPTTTTTSTVATSAADIIIDVPISKHNGSMSHAAHTILDKPKPTSLKQALPNAWPRQSHKSHITGACCVSTCRVWVCAYVSATAWYTNVQYHWAPMLHGHPVVRPSNLRGPRTLQRASMYTYVSGCGYAPQ